MTTLPDAVSDIDASFTLDTGLLEQRRAATARRLHTVQIPLVRTIGFVMLCLIAALQTWRQGTPLVEAGWPALVAFNMGYALASWAVLRAAYGRTGRLDLGLLCLHVDLAAWLVNLHFVEHGYHFVGLLLLVRVADQLGFGFRRALYFAHVVVAAYLAYAALLDGLDAGEPHWPDRLLVAATMYLVGIYISLTGVLTERLRRRMRSAVHAARELVQALEQRTTALQDKTAALQEKTAALEVQAHELERARRDAEQAYAAKSQFLAMVSHEIRTPMNAVLGTTELLLDAALPEPQRRLAETAHRSAGALLALIDDVLDLSSIDAGQLALNITPFRLRPLVQETVDLMAAEAHDKPVQMGCTIAPEAADTLHGDPVRLRQVLVNLLHNAIKFTDRGSVQIEVSVLEDAADAALLRFAVRDTGIGVPPGAIPYLFDRFTQADPSSTRRHGGTGLGLAIVKEIVALMGGTIGVDSRPGQGSTFWFDLRLRKARPVAPAPAPPGAPPGVPRVLVVEDDPVNRMVVEQMLHRLGCRVELVDNGADALRAVREADYDLVLMDCYMPVMDGFEATRRMRADARGALLPIVALTASALENDRQRALDSGMDDVATKPVMLAQLQAIVERWARRGPDRASGPPES